MIRLLFTTQGHAKQLTVITDGIDGQLNVFVTQNVVGDVEYFKSLGIVIEAGQTYNIGELKQMAVNNDLRLMSYPEGYGEKVQPLVTTREDYQYTFSVDQEVVPFANTGELKNLGVKSTKRLLINGQPQGDPIPVACDYLLVGSPSPFMINMKTGDVIVDENPTEQIRTDTVHIMQHETHENVTVELQQAASVITYDYVLTVDPTSIAFAAAGETKSFVVVSTKQKKLNGQNNGSPVNVSYTTTVTGTGFSKGGNDTTVVAAANSEATERSGSVVVTASEGGKSATITLTQAGTTA